MTNEMINIIKKTKVDNKISLKHNCYLVTEREIQIN